jgi:hypothetical protein
MTKSDIASLMAEIEEDLRFFQDAMRYKLEKNAHKGRWERLDIANALLLLKQEVDELEESIAKGNNVEIIMESADVANFAMICAVIATKYTQRK